MQPERGEREPLLKQTVDSSESRKDPISKVNDEEKNEDFSFSKIPRQKKILLVSMATVNFFSVTCFSLLAPFFPAEVR